MRDKYLIPIIVHRSSRLLPPPRKLWEGNVFTTMCLFTGEGVGMPGPKSILGVGIPEGGWGYEKFPSLPQPPQPQPFVFFVNIS